MSKQSASSDVRQTSPRSDMERADAAIHRAAVKARERAWNMGARVAVWRNGRIVYQRRPGIKGWLSEKLIRLARKLT